MIRSCRNRRRAPTGSTRCQPNADDRHLASCKESSDQGPNIGEYFEGSISAAPQWRSGVYWILSEPYLPSGARSGCYVLLSMYGLSSKSGVWYLLEFSGPRCASALDHPDELDFARVSELEVMLESLDVQWSSGHEGDEDIRSNFSHHFVKPSKLERLVTRLY